MIIIKLIRNMGFRINKRPTHHSLALIFGVVLLLYFLPTLALEIIPANLGGKKLFETHDSDVKVSGNIIVGVMISSAYQGLLMDQLGIQSPDAGEKDVCLKVTSRDGAYMSENNYRVKAPEPAIVYLPYQSALHDVIENYSNEQGSIAITATEGGCDQTATAVYFLPAILNRDKESLVSGDLSIYINGFDATDVYYRIVEIGTEDIFDCDYIEEGRHTAYNFICAISKDDLPLSGQMTIEISREVYGRELGPVKIRLLAAD